MMKNWLKYLTQEELQDLQFQLGQHPWTPPTQDQVDRILKEIRAAQTERSKGTALNGLFVIVCSDGSWCQDPFGESGMLNGGGPVFTEDKSVAERYAAEVPEYACKRGPHSVAEYRRVQPHESDKR